MKENDNSLFLLFVLLLLLGLTYMNELHAVDIGDLVKHCNFDTGKVEISEVVDKPIVPAINGDSPAIELRDGLVIRPSEILVNEFTTNCI